MPRGSPVLVTVTWLSLVIASCGGDASKLRLGSVCASDEACASGLCAGGRCLDPAADDDRDGLVNALEVDVLGTDPTRADTDGDGAPDVDEIDGVTTRDTDGDGKSDAVESATADADGDCIPDQYDAEDGVDNSDLSPLVDVVCAKAGVCATQRAALRVTCEGAPRVATCDYGLVEGYEDPEASCDARDNDCDGQTDEGAAADACEPTLLGLVVNPTRWTLEVGATQALVATGTYDDASSRDVSSEATWTSEAPAIATVSANGIVTAVAAGEARIVATLDGVSASATVTVTPRPRVLTAIEVTPQDPTTPLGVPVTFVATGHFDDGSEDILTATATWASSVPAVATVAAGVATTVAQGDTIITARLDGVTGDSTLTVGPPVPLALRIDPASPTVAATQTTTLGLVATLSDGSEVDRTAPATWTSDAPGVATVSGGVVTGVAVGQASITAALGELDAQVTVVVTAKPRALVSIDVTPIDPMTPLGVDLTLMATGRYDDESVADLTTTATWRSLSPGVATVSASGAVTTVGVGQARIEATAEGVTGASVVTVGPAAIEEVTLGPLGLVVPKGTTAQLTATALMTDGTTADVADRLAWSSDDEGRATVDDAGVVTGIGTGTVTIRAADGARSWSLLIAVGGPIAVSIRLEPADPRVAVGATLQLAAIGAMSDETEQDLSAQVTWSSDDPAIATVDAMGVATGVLMGDVVVRAALGEVVGTATLDVFVPLPLPLVVASPRVRAVVPSDRGVVDRGTIVAGPPVRAVVVSDRGIVDRGTVVAAPSVRAVVIESTRPTAGSGVGALGVVTSRPPIRAVVIESEDVTSARLAPVVARPPVKVGHEAD